MTGTTAPAPRPSAAVQLLAFVAPVAVLFALAWQRLPGEDAPAYFAFVDQRPWVGIPNAWNVLSNLAFLGSGWAVWRRFGRDTESGTRQAGTLLAIGTGLTALGSAYFHWSPSPDTLFWDRLPMALAFSGAFLLVVADRFEARLAGALLWPVTVASVGTVLLWRFGGSLRPYMSLQLGLMVVLVPILLLRRRGRIPNLAFAWLLAWYAVAKVLEAQDEAVFTALRGVASGHGLKHFAAALGVWGVSGIYSLQFRWPGRG